MGFIRGKAYSIISGKARGGDQRASRLIMNLKRMPQEQVDREVSAILGSNGQMSMSQGQQMANAPMQMSNRAPEMEQKVSSPDGELMANLMSELKGQPLNDKFGNEKRPQNKHGAYDTNGSFHEGTIENNEFVDTNGRRYPMNDAGQIIIDAEEDWNE